MSHDPAARDGEPAGTRVLLDRLADGDPTETLSMADLLARLDGRGFGLLLCVAVLPAFIPVPVGGAISGPLCALLGLQMLLGQRKPWLPTWLARRGPTRGGIARFRNRLSPWLQRIERGLRPRLGRLLQHPLAHATTGVLVLLLGVLLSLPVPFTNYVFAGLLLLFAVALIERDGLLLLGAWIIGAITLLAFGLLSDEIMDASLALWRRLLD
jgi:hypothetical protein